MEKIREHVYLFGDTCNVYVVQNGRSAVLIDFGSGDVLDHLSEIGVEQVGRFVVSTLPRSTPACVQGET